MANFIKTLLPFLTLTFFSCGSDEPTKEQPKEKWENEFNEQMSIDSLNKTEVKNLSKKYDAILGWDTSLIYTYQLQDLLSTTKKPLTFIGKIKDIIKKDSNYIIFATSSWTPFMVSLYYIHTNSFSNKDYLAEFTVPSSKFEEMRSLLSPGKEAKEVCFILNCDKVISSSKIALDIQNSGSEAEKKNFSSEQALSLDKTLVILKGEILDFYLYKNKKEDN